MLRRHVVTATLFLALFGSVSQLHAQDERISVGPLVGINFEFEEVFFGVEAWIPLESVQVGDNTLVIAPTFRLFPFIGGESAGSVDIDSSLWSVGGDAVLPFDMGGNATPFVRGGIVVQRFSSTISGLESVEGSGSSTKARLHLAGGSTFGPPDGGKFNAQVGVLIGDGSQVYLQGGYQIPIG